MKKIFIATGNKSKLNDFLRLFKWIDQSLQAELVPNYVEVEEIGKTLEGNSLLKVKPYIGKYQYPVISNDSGLFFPENIKEIQDPVKVKRNALNGRDEKTLTQAEIAQLMYKFYKDLARNYGGSID